VSDVAGFLRVNPATAWNWVKLKKLKSRKRRGVIVVRFGDIVEMAIERGLYERPSGIFILKTGGRRLGGKDSEQNYSNRDIRE
jgi:hypothetical protein